MEDRDIVLFIQLGSPVLVWGIIVGGDWLARYRARRDVRRRLFRLCSGR